MIKCNGYRPTEIQAREALEVGAGTFGEILKRVDISRPALNDALKDLREKNDVEKYYDEEKDKLMYRLTKRGADPIRSTILRLNKIEAKTNLNSQKGRKLLINRVVEWVKEVGREERKERGLPWAIEFDEHFLLKALTRYVAERNIFTIKIDEETFKKHFDKHITTPYHNNVLPNEILKIISEDGIEPDRLPVFRKAKEKGIISNVDNLLVWIRPLLEPEPFKEEDPERIHGIESYSFTLKASNLAAAVCRSELLHWYETLMRSWRAKISQLSKEEGGEESKNA